MSYLVDTNVFSEPARPKPDVQVVAWLRENKPLLCASTITIGELRRGIERLPFDKRKVQFHKWLQALCECMKGRVLSFNTRTAHVRGQMKVKWD